MKPRNRWPIISLLLLATLTACNSNGGGSKRLPPNPAITFDCRADDGNCPEITISGDPEATLPDMSLSPWRGMGDPSIRKDPNSSRLWMSYTKVHAQVDAGPPILVNDAVSVHLAYSDDGGATWTFERNIWESSAETDPGGATADAGYSGHEVSTITPFTAGASDQWFGLHLRYFYPLGENVAQRRGDSYHFRLASATTANALGDNAEAVLGGPLTANGWNANLNLSSLDPELADCLVWTEPSLFQDKSTLYLMAQCLKLDVSLERIPAEEFIGLFKTAASGAIDSFTWQWVGKVTTAANAQELGGEVLTQADFAYGRDGHMLLIVTPKDLDPQPRHKGCMVLELDSLEPPVLHRQSNGDLTVRAAISSSDSANSGITPPTTIPGNGLCAYDPDSNTGVLFVRFTFDTSVPELVFHLHQTGIHP